MTFALLRDRWLVDQLKANRGLLILSVGLTFATVAVFLVMPRWAASLLQDKLPTRAIGDIVPHLFIGLLVFVTGSLLGLFRAIATSTLLHKLTTKVRERLFSHILSISPRQVSATRSAEVLSRVSNDVMLFQGAMSSIVSNLIPSSILALCFSVAMFWYSPIMFGLIVIMLSPLALVSSFFGRKLHTMSHQSQESIAKLMARFEELLAGAREIKAFGRENAVGNRFTILNVENLRILMKQERLDALHPVAVALTAAIGAVVLLVLSLWLIDRELIRFEDLTSFFVCLLMAYSPIQEASFAGSRIMQLRAVMERLEFILNIEPEVDGSLASPAINVRFDICFENVSFRYNDDGFALKDLNLSIPFGQMVALVGPSGAGKSTLIDLIPRFLSPTTGRVLIGNEDIRNYKLADLRGLIGFVSQEPILFEASIEDNLRFGAPSINREDLMAAARAANVDEFVQRMPNGYASQIEFRGRNLSVGQRQRIALARVLIRNPRLLLLDEPTSALDAVSEDLVRDALKTASAGRTTLVVAHRMSTIRDADRVLVMQKGQIIEDGTHDALRRAHGLYDKLYEAQLLHAEHVDVQS